MLNLSKLTTNFSPRILPVCCNCGKIRDDLDQWYTPDFEVKNSPDTIVTHGLCPDCTEQLYGDFLKD